MTAVIRDKSGVFSLTSVTITVGRSPALVESGVGLVKARAMKAAKLEYVLLKNVFTVRGPEGFGWSTQLLDLLFDLRQFH